MIIQPPTLSGCTEKGSGLRRGLREAAEGARSIGTKEEKERTMVQTYFFCSHQDPRSASA